MKKRAKKLLNLIDKSLMFVFLGIFGIFVGLVVIIFQKEEIPDG